MNSQGEGKVVKLMKAQLKIQNVYPSSQLDSFLGRFWPPGLILDTPVLDRLRKHLTIRQNHHKIITCGYKHLTEEPPMSAGTGNPSQREMLKSVYP